MQILSTTGGTMNFIPREDISGAKTYSLVVKSENKNKILFTDSNPTINALKFYNTYVTTQTFLENSFYTLEIKNTTDNKLIFRDMIFCTNQPEKTYEMTNGLFTEHDTGANEFIYYTEN